MRDWLVRMSKRGLKGRFNRRRMGRRSKLPSSIFKTVRKWLLKEPNKYGFESGSWQLNMILEMIKREFGIDCKIRTLRRKLGAGLGSPGESADTSRTNRPPRRCRKSSSRWPAGRQRSTARRGAPHSWRMRQGYRYRRTPATGGGPPTDATPSPIGFSKKSVRLIGIMGEDVLYVRTVESTNSETFIDFLKDVLQRHPELYMVLDNASYHKSHAVNAYVEGTKRSH